MIRFIIGYHVATTYELYDDLGHIDMDYYLKLYDEESRRPHDTRRD